MRIGLCLVSLCVGAAAYAQDFPTRPLRLIVPSPPGGGFDLVARVVADKMAEPLGQSIVIENRAGAGTLIGTELGAKAAPDGYTLVVAGTPNLALNAGLYRALPYDPLRDFTPIGIATAFSYTLIARKDFAPSSLRELVDFARANPEKLSYASGGNGTGQHVAFAVFAHLTKLRALHVPYKGAQAAYQDLLAGRVDLFFDNTSTARSHVDSGAVKAFAVSSRERQPVHPHLPTVIETGIVDFDIESWFGYFAPAKTPSGPVTRLREAFTRALEHPDVVARFQKSGARVLKLSASEADSLVKRDIEKWTRLIRQADLRAD